MRDRRHAFGLFSEIIAWKLRLFVPAVEGGGHTFVPLIARYPGVDLGGRDAK